jgi:hypothetical protein
VIGGGNLDGITDVGAFHLEVEILLVHVSCL